MKWVFALWALAAAVVVANWQRDENSFEAGRMDVLRDCALEGQVVVNDRVYSCVAIPVGAAVPEQPKKPTINPSEI